MLSPCLFNFYAEYIMWNAGLEEAQAEIKIARRNTSNLRYADDTILMAEREELEPLDESERGEWKSWLKLNIQKTKIMASGPITSWQIDGETVETVTNLDSILKSRDITLPTKVRLVNAMVFPIVMYGCKSWTIKKLSTEELMVLNSGVVKDSWESPGLQRDPTSQS